MRGLFFTALVMLAALMLVRCPLRAEPTWPEVNFTETKNLDYNNYRGHATLSLEKTTLNLGDKFAVGIRFDNDGGESIFYNPFFLGLTSLPAQLAIFDSDKKYLGDLLYRSNIISRKIVSPEDWMYIPPRAYVGIELDGQTAGNLDQGAVKLPAGDYYLQMIYNNLFITPNPASTANEKETIINFYKIEKTELFRSNAIKIHFKEADKP